MDPNNSTSQPDNGGTPTPQDDGAQGTPTPQNADEGTQAEGEGTEAEAEATAKPEAEAKPEGEAKPEKPKTGQVPWFQRRIDDLTREKHEARRQAAALELTVKEQKEALEALAKGETPKPGTKPGEDLTVEQRAAAIAQQREFDQQCNAIYDKGKEAYPDFDQALRSYANLGGLTPQLIEAAIEAGNPHQILYELTQDMDEASRVLALSPTRQAVALAKLASKLSAKPKPTAAPAPIKPLTTNGASIDKDPEQMSTAEWMDWRAKQIEKKRALH